MAIGDYNPILGNGPKPPTWNAYAQPGAPTAALPSPLSGVFNGSSSSAPNIKDTLDAITDPITNRSARADSAALRARVLPGVNSQPAATPQYTDPFAGLDLYEYSGGPNAALLASLRSQREQLMKNYTQNRADVENLYGVLSQEEGVASTGLLGDIEQYGADLQKRYDTTMGDMASAQTAYQQGITDQRATQGANRSNAAAELGLAAESLIAPPSTALDEISAMSGAAAENWRNLFSANKLFEQGSTSRQLTGAENTRNNQLLAMKRYLDDQQAAIDSEIAMEQSKSPTKSLTALGRAIEAATNEQIVNQLFPEAPGLTPRQQDAANAMIDLGLTPGNPADDAAFSALQEEAYNAYNNFIATGQPLTRQQAIALEAMGVPLGYMNPNYAGFTNN